MNILLIFLLAQTKPAMKNVSCTMTNHIYQMVTKKGDKWVTEDRDDWHVKCKVEVSGKVKSDEELVLAHPVEYRDAMVAIDEFRKTH